MEHLLLFQTYASIDEANAVADKLQQAGITTEVLKAAPRFPAVIIGSDYSDNYILKIPADDFSKANKLLYSDTPIDINLIEADHPLQAMSNDELREVLAKPDEWGPDNYKVALTLLDSRGITLTGDTLDKLKDRRTDELARTKSMNPLIIFIGYFMGCYPLTLYILNKLGYPAISILMYFGVLSEFLWFLGIIVGFVILGSKNTLPDGTRVPTYDSITRNHGKAILAIYGLTLLAILSYNAWSL